MAATSAAPWRLRAEAILIDGALTFAASLYLAGTVGPRDVMEPGDGFLFWWMLLGAVYFTALPGLFRGQTVGKSIAGIRVIRPDGAPIGYGRAFSRWAITGVLWTFGVWIGGVIDSMAPFFDERRRTIHDRVVDTIVVRAGSGA